MEFGVSTVASAGVFAVSSLALVVTYVIWLVGLDRDARLMTRVGIAALASMGLHVVGLLILSPDWWPEVHFLTAQGFLYLVVIWGASFVAVNDIDLIERRLATPSSSRWTAAAGMVVSIMWVYLELVRFQYFSRRPDD